MLQTQTNGDLTEPENSSVGDVPHRIVKLTSASPKANGEKPNTERTGSSKQGIRSRLTIPKLSGQFAHNRRYSDSNIDRSRGKSHSSPNDNKEHHTGHSSEPSRNSQYNAVQKRMLKSIVKVENPVRLMFTRLSQRAQLNFRAWLTKSEHHASEHEILQRMEKSALLFNELAYVAPMTIALASTMLMNDGTRKVPVLFELISVSVERAEGDQYAKNTMAINLIYGGGPSAMKWEVLRAPRDFFLLHGHILSKSVRHRRSTRPPKLPRPRQFNLDVDATEDAEAEGEADALGVNPDRSRAVSLSSASSASSVRTQSTTYEEAIQHYIESLLRIFRFRADSERLLMFLELSKMSILLAPEYTFHGKEGNVIVSGRASSQGWRVRHWQPQDVGSMISRHTAKWMLVRDSFVVLVENISSTQILDVFLVDSSFHIKHVSGSSSQPQQSNGSQSSTSLSLTNKRSTAAPEVKNVTPVSGYFLHLENGSRELRLATKSEHEIARWQSSIQAMLSKSSWADKNRFDSFAPVRKNVFGQWFVDGRDYFYVLSEALENARDTIYILDWWLSPELYLRRPPEGNQQWRLDRVLKRKAEEGVKIFIVVYRNVGATIPIDSMWSKHSMLDLHPNIHILRSPNQFLQKSAVFWAHHEKLCIIDNTVAFNGGLDLCFGRYDTPQHTLVDDAELAFYKSNTDAENRKKKTQVWPGKDYSNPRVGDFFDLDKPYDDMYDRQNVPRMPWHDVHQMVIGQPARDFSRHFVQRWNYVIRQKLPSRPTPLLLPPPDFSQEELDRLQLTGTCEYQCLRSASQWSSGLKTHEQSIQNAYLKLIDESEHLVYIENQFFVTSTEVDGVVIENKIGTALVQRILRAFQNKEKWHAIIIIPLMPGFEAEVDTPEASSVRVICQCQFNSISRGRHSIFYHLEKAGVRPEQYISFMSLRKWDKIGPDRTLVTEQLYIHAKTMIVDDRIALIGSANINERSQRGVRDSEIAVVVRDTQVVHSRMAGKPWEAANFAHSLRLRLMREHMGIDVDKVEIIEQVTGRLMEELEKPANDTAGTPRLDSVVSGQFDDGNLEWMYPDLHGVNYYAGTETNPGLHDKKKISHDKRVHHNPQHFADVNGDGYDRLNERKKIPRTFADLKGSAAPIDDDDERQATILAVELFKSGKFQNIQEIKEALYETWVVKDTRSISSRGGNVLLPIVDDEGHVINNAPIKINPWDFVDPVCEEFLIDKWLLSAERNTALFRQVFRCQPDNEVQTWKDYKKFTAYNNAFMKKQKAENKSEEEMKPERVDNHELEDMVEHDSPTSPTDKMAHGDLSQPGKKHDHPDRKSKRRNSSHTGRERANSTSSSSSSSSASSSDAEPDGGLRFPKEATSSSAAGVPGIPSINYLLGRNKPFKKASAVEEEANEDSDDSDENVSSHADSRKNTSTDHRLQDGSHVAIKIKNETGLTKITKVMREDENGSLVSENPSVHDEEFEKDDGDKSGNRPGVLENAPESQTSRIFASRRQWSHFDQIYSKTTAENILQAVTGRLVVFPSEWLSRELDSDNWYFQMDRMTPLEIYD